MVPAHRFLLPARHQTKRAGGQLLLPQLPRDVLVGAVMRIPLVLESQLLNRLGSTNDFLFHLFSFPAYLSVSCGWAGRRWQLHTVGPKKLSLYQGGPTSYRWSSVPRYRSLGTGRIVVVSFPKVSQILSIFYWWLMPVRIILLETNELADLGSSSSRVTSSIRDWTFMRQHLFLACPVLVKSSRYYQ